MAIALLHRVFVVPNVRSISQPELVVAQGLTNPQVVNALLMSPATVETHLGCDFAQIGISIRANRPKVAH